MEKLVALIILSIFAVQAQRVDDDSCHSFAGGQVYPQETRRTSGHTIQWSQAVSKSSL